jgi:hypothetical protein
MDGWTPAASRRTPFTASTTLAAAGEDEASFPSEPISQPDLPPHGWS